MKVIFRLKNVNLLHKENYISMAHNIINMWNNMKDLEAMVIPKDVEVYVVDSDSEIKVEIENE